eukprot:GHVU01084458.1.p1 GENE.GHVU01084458.1~~GHVU01084458.1.p1  ORF type:complete len:107 (-),score=6.77 GHVU01084458.1:867-1187(-)
MDGWREGGRDGSVGLHVREAAAARPPPVRDAPATAPKCRKDKATLGRSLAYINPYRYAYIHYPPSRERERYKSLHKLVLYALVGLVPLFVPGHSRVYQAGVAVRSE